MRFSLEQREIVLKVVFYGAPLCGKTTNLQILHQRLNPATRGKLTVLDTADDRTLFFDLLPLVLETSTGFCIRLKLYTVPGQVIHAATRRLVLDGADAVVFVADSQRSQGQLNNQFWHGMRQYLVQCGIDPDRIPMIIQFNKRDLPGVRSDEELDVVASRGREPIYKAVAVHGEGVLETLHAILQMMLADLNEQYGFEKKFGMTEADFQKAVFGDWQHDPFTASRAGRGAP